MLHTTNGSLRAVACPANFLGKHPTCGSAPLPAMRRKSDGARRENARQACAQCIDAMHHARTCTHTDCTHVVLIAELSPLDA
jgi:hypothetical protein